MNVLLSTVLDQGLDALAALAIQLPDGEVLLDCTAVDALPPATLDALLAHIPTEWGFAELAEVIDASTLTSSLAEQLATWVDQRLAQAADASTTSRSPADVRRALVDTFMSEMCGPSDGENEIIDGASVRGRYLVGMLAPKGQRALAENYDEDESAGIDGEDGIAEARPSKASSAMLPSSIGLSFTVAPEATALRVRVRWGRYHRRRLEGSSYISKSGNPYPIWQREQIDKMSDPIPLGQSTIVRWKPNPEQPDVYIEGVIRPFDGQRVVTLFLVNGQAEHKPQDAYWLFQPELTVEATDGTAIFAKRLTASTVPDPEDQLMAMLYRRRVEFAVGHGVAVTVERDPARFDRARVLRTTVMPMYELPQTVPVSVDDDPLLAGVIFDMRALANVADGGFHAAIGGLLDAYAAWIVQQEHRLTPPEPDLAGYASVGRLAMQRCRATLDRMRTGLALLDANPDAAQAFRFANRAMDLQRVRTLHSASVRRGKSIPIEQFDAPQHHSWRPFQLGFILLNLPALTDLTHPERSVAPGTNPGANTADLLWFPTGGGKTEAYLGLTAYTIAIRRLQGEVGGRDGQNGVAVLMRYTLRLLTFQQFQRAATLICACEIIRREDPVRWGSVPIRLGLWVGSKATPNSVEEAQRSIQAYRDGNDPGGGTPHQLTSCPWCGTPIDAGTHLDPQPAPNGAGRVLTYCGSYMNLCPFNRRTAAGEGLPVMVVDDEIYGRLPALLIATVDKFAQMPWNGKTAALFGHVNARCERHGFRTPDTEDEASHRPSPRYGLPAAHTVATALLRPPDLIIQDELHLISGPLGTLVGLYETAVDTLSSWQVQGVTVRPKVIASTATIRRARDQVYGLFWRQVEIFPPQGLDVEDNFFARQREGDPHYPGRLYLGLCSPGVRNRFLLVQAYVALLAAAQYLFDNGYGKEVDPWMTLVGYFNALRELAAMRRSVDDSVRTRLRKMDQRGLAKRFLTAHNNQDLTSVQELTSRLSAADIPRVLDRLELPFDPADRQPAGESGGKHQPKRTRTPIDVLLATNMISVGVDVGRLGLMVVAGQPKATAEYIQATSRVGRNTPGIVCTIYNWARPRDMSHYERFGHYHATFYQHVEALSVTPFSSRALDRGLTGVLAALIRLGGPEFNANRDAHEFDKTHPRVLAALEALRTRAAAVQNARVADLTFQAARQRVEEWVKKRDTLSSSRLGYKDDGPLAKLLKSPEDQEGSWDLFTCLNSLRDVEPTVNLVMQDHAMDEGANRGWVFEGVPEPIVDEASGDQTTDEVTQ